MDPFTIGLALTSALASRQAAQRKNEQLARANKAASEQTRYSAWSGLGQGQLNNNFADPNSAMLGGGLAGLSTAQSLRGMGGSAGGGQTMFAGDPMDAQMQQNVLGTDPSQFHQRSAWANVA